MGEILLAEKLYLFWGWGGILVLEMNEDCQANR